MSAKYKNALEPCMAAPLIDARSNVIEASLLERFDQTYVSMWVATVVVAFYLEHISNQTSIPRIKYTQLRLSIYQKKKYIY